MQLACAPAIREKLVRGRPAKRYGQYLLDPLTKDLQKSVVDLLALDYSRALFRAEIQWLVPSDQGRNTEYAGTRSSRSTQAGRCPESS